MARIVLALENDEPAQPRPEVTPITSLEQARAAIETLETTDVWGFHDRDIICALFRYFLTKHPIN